MTFEQIFQGQTVLARAERHLSNRAAACSQGRLVCIGQAEKEAIYIMNGLLNDLASEFNQLALLARARKHAVRSKA